MTSKKVLWYLWSFTLGGGAEKILATIANHLNSAEYQQAILEIDQFDKPMPTLRSEIKVLPPLQVKGGSRIKEALVWRLRQWLPQLVRRYLVRDDYDIEVSFTVMNPPLPFSMKPGVKKIAWIHGSVESFLEQPRYLADYRRFLQTADTIVAISEKTKQSIEQVFPEQADKIHLIYNGYDFEQIRQQAQAEMALQLEPNSLIAIGRIEKLKGSDRLVQLIQQLHQKGQPYHLYFIGSGELESSLQAEVKRLGLQEYIHFLGYQVNPYPYLKQAKALVSMSLQEGFPGVLVESLALGVPFVTTDVGGAVELSQNGRFGQIIASDEEAMTAIQAYMSGEQQLDQEAVRGFIEQFTIANQVAQVEQLFTM